MMKNKQKDFRDRQISEDLVNKSDGMVWICADPDIIPESRIYGVKEAVPEGIFKPQRPDPDLDSRFCE